MTRCERDEEPGVVAIAITFLFRRSDEAEAVGEVSADSAQLAGRLYAESDDASVRGRPINPRRRWRTEPADVRGDRLDGAPDIPQPVAVLEIERARESHVGDTGACAYAVELVVQVPDTLTDLRIGVPYPQIDEGRVRSHAI